MVKHLPIGIDLGTSTSEICVFRNNQPYPIPDPSSDTKTPVMPSLVSIDTRGILQVGEAASQRVDRPGYGIREIKRKMGTGETIRLLDKVYRPEEISAQILKTLKENAEQVLGTAIHDVVLSVPANFPDAARQATITAGELAGLNVIRLINEPTAAALAFGVEHLEAEEQLVVFDFGGGTLDISVLEMMSGVMDTKCSYGDPQLGGKDFDDVLIQLILKKFKQQNSGVSINERVMQELKKTAERAKISLSSNYSTTVQMYAFGFSQGQPIDLELEITRAEFEKAAAPLFDRTRECIRRTLEAKSIQTSQIDRILLVGGSTYMPAIRQIVAQMFGKEPSTAISPDLAVAMGASIQAAIITGQISQENAIILTDVAPYGLGLEIVKEIGGQRMLVYESLIEPNTTIPYSMSRRYSLLEVDQKDVEVHLYQAHHAGARLLEEVEDTGIHGSITNIPPSRTGEPHPIEVDFSYDLSGSAKVHASIPTTGQSVDIVYFHSDKRLDGEEKTLALVRVNELWQQSAKSRQYREYLAKAEHLLAEIPVRERARLSMAADALREALSSAEAAAIDTAADRLIDMLFELENGLEGQASV